MSAADLHRAAQAAAHRLLAEAMETKAVQPVEVVVRADGLTVRVLVEADPSRREPALTACETDLLTLLASATMPWTTSRVLREMEARDMLHGESTTKRALAKLVRLGRVVSRARPPRGYHLPRGEHP